MTPEQFNHYAQQASSLDGVKRNRGRGDSRLSSIPPRYIEATCYKNETNASLPDELHKKPCNQLTLKQKLKLLYWRCKS